MTRSRAAPRSRPRWSGTATARGGAASGARRGAALRRTAGRRPTGGDLGRELLVLVDVGHVDERAHRGGVVVQALVADAEVALAPVTGLGAEAGLVARGRPDLFVARLVARSSAPLRSAARSSAGAASGRRAHRPWGPRAAAGRVAARRGRAPRPGSRSAGNGNRAAGCTSSGGAAAPAARAAPRDGDARGRPRPRPGPLRRRGSARPRRAATRVDRHRSRARDPPEVSLHQARPAALPTSAPPGHLARPARASYRELLSAPAAGSHPLLAW